MEGIRFTWTFLGNQRVQRFFFSVRLRRQDSKLVVAWPCNPCASCFSDSVTGEEIMRNKVKELGHVPLDEESLNARGRGKRGSKAADGSRSRCKSDSLAALNCGFDCVTFACAYRLQARSHLLGSLDVNQRTVLCLSSSAIENCLTSFRSQR